MQICANHDIHSGALGRSGAPDAAPLSLAGEAAALNAELFEFFGAQHDASAPATEPLAQLINAQADQGAGGRRGAGPPVPAASAAAAAAPGPRLTHVDASGRASMVDVGGKRATARSATAAARVLLGPRAFQLVADNRVAKGDVLTVAQLAGVMGAKHTSALIPLCHPLALSHVEVRLALDPAACAVDVTATAATVGPTGVEMEAMTAAAVAALTVYDMCKAASKGIEVTGVRLLRKSGGKSGEWVRGEGGDERGGGAR
jgi:molybdenum cofactor biosynthesis protein MoaC